MQADIGGGPSALRQVVGLMLRHRHVELDTFSVVRASPGSADQVWHMTTNLRATLLPITYYLRDYTNY